MRHDYVPEYRRLLMARQSTTAAAPCAAAPVAQQPALPRPGVPCVPALNRVPDAAEDVLPLDGRCKARWDRNADGVREEFLSIEGYTAYARAVAGGRVRIISRASSATRAGVDDLDGFESTAVRDAFRRAEARGLIKIRSGKPGAAAA